MTPPEFVRPATGAGSVTSVVPACLTGAVPAEFPGPVAGARVRVVLVLDGLGWNSLQRHSGAMPVLSQFVGGPVTTVVPSTTATALTSITTGLPPGDHGVMGYRFLVDGQVLNALRWTTDDGAKAPDPFTVQRHPPFMRREIPVVTRRDYRYTGFTKAHLRDTRMREWVTEAMIVERVRTLVADGETFVYVYYPGVDSVAHEFGLDNHWYEAELRATDAMVEQVLAVLPDDAVLAVTADHGQVDVGANNGWIDVPQLYPMVRVSAGEGRFRQYFARQGAVDDLAAAAKEVAGDDAYAFTRDELFDGGWFGPDPSPVARRRVGDVVLAARAPVGYLDPASPGEGNLKSAHGSLTADEMLVPLVAARGTA